MTTRVGNVVFDVPSPKLEVYSEKARGIAALYADLLGQRLCTRAEIYREANYPADEGDEADPLVISGDPTRPSIAFESSGDAYRAPAWPDLERPQQVHLDLTVPDVEAAHDVVSGYGATLLRDNGDHRVYADCVGHPFCLYPGGAPPNGRIERIVVDCPNPRTLALFYGDLLDMPVRVRDEVDRVEIARQDGTGPNLAFQHALSAAPRWPDPKYPQQLHLDLAADDEQAAGELALRLGAIRLPYAGGGFVYADPAGHPFCLGE